MSATSSATSPAPGVPAGWRRASLGELCRVVGGSTPASGTPDFWNGDIVWVTPTDLGALKNIHITTSARRISQLGYDSCGTELLPPGTVVLSSRAPIGHLGIASVPLCTNQGCKSFLPGPELDSEFLFFALRHHVSDLQALGSGATFKEVSKSALGAFPLSFPPLPEQRRIAAKLRVQMGAIDRARRNTEVQLKAASAILSSYLRDAFDGPRARTWQTCRLGDLLVQRREVVHPKDGPSGPAVFVGLEHIESTTGRRTGSVPLEMSHLTGRKPRFAKGDIVYGYLRPYLNKVWIADFDGLCSVDQFAYQVRGDSLDAEYIAWFMRSPTYLRLSQVQTTTGQLPRIGVEEVAAVQLPYPSASERRSTAIRINQYFEKVSQLRSGLDETASALHSLPAALLREAFSGRL